MLEVADKRYFQGLPSPSAAALIAGSVFTMDDYGVAPAPVQWWAWASTLAAGLVMVSNLKYYSGKAINLKKSVPFVAVILFVVLIALLSYQPAVVLFGGFVAYFVSGFVMSAWAMLRKRRHPPAPS